MPKKRKVTPLKKSAPTRKRRKEIAKLKAETAGVPGITASHDMLDAHYGGKWLRMHGLKDGVTDAMVRWVEKQCGGKGNLDRTRKNCEATLDGLRGYLDATAGPGNS